MPEGDTPHHPAEHHPAEPIPRHILIAGGGIGGLTAALMFARRGWRVTICDKEPALHEVGAGIQLSPNASRHLIALGLGDALAGPAVRPDNLMIHRARDGALLNTARLGLMAEGRYGAPFLAIHRGDLQQILLRRAQSLPQITLRLGLALHELRMDEERVTGIFRHAGSMDDDANDERISADVLVGADGLWSRARTLAGLPSPSLTSGKSAWRTLIPRDAAPIFAREANTNLWMGEGAHLVHYPVCGGEMINVVAITEDHWQHEGWNTDGDADILRARFSGWCSKVRDLIHAAEHWKRWALLDRAPESRWSRGRMTLLGDAAHPMLPFLAQGASQAIEDAAALVSELETAHAGTSIEAALKRYDRLRIPRTARIQRQSRQQARIYHLTGPLATARDLAISTLPGTLLLRRYGWVYTHDSGENRT